MNLLDAYIYAEKRQSKRVLKMSIKVKDPALVAAANDRLSMSRFNLNKQQKEQPLKQEL